MSLRKLLKLTSVIVKRFVISPVQLQINCKRRALQESYKREVEMYPYGSALLH